jgi:regulator of sigma E protease
MYGGSLVGITKWIEFATLLSLNLAVVNMLPIPILDGGKILLHSLADLDPRVFRFQMPLALAGLFVIIGVMVYTTVMDVLRLVA